MVQKRVPPVITQAIILVFGVLLAAAGPSAESAKGHLVVIGGGSRPASIMALFACLAGGSDGRVIAFSQASERPEAGAEIEEELKSLGLGRVRIVSVDREGADSGEAVRLVDGTTGVYFGGGDQGRLMAVLRGTRLERRLQELYREGAVMAGTSAGAAVMSRVMITGDENRPLSKDDSWQTIEADNVVTGLGLGYLEDAVVDQHFVRRRRHNRLLSVVLERPELLGIAVDESTAAWVKPDRTVEVVGDGPVLLFDASGAAVARDPEGQGLRGADLRLHVLRAGALYDLATRKVVRLAALSASLDEGPTAERCVPR